jgi:four helix bundle protein
MKKKFLTLNDISAYKLALILSQYVWEIVVKWDYFSRDTVGKQFVTALDSISANIAEGFGRYYKREKVQFYRYSYGSIVESLDWNEKSLRRKLICREKYYHILGELKRLPQEINNLINYTNEKLKK